MSANDIIPHVCKPKCRACRTVEAGIANVNVRNVALRLAVDVSRNRPDITTPGEVIDIADEFATYLLVGRR